MCDVSSFAQISSVLAQRSTAPVDTQCTTWQYSSSLYYLSSRPRKGPVVVWHPSKMPWSQLLILQQDGGPAAGGAENTGVENAGAITDGET